MYVFSASPNCGPVVFKCPLSVPYLSLNCFNTGTLSTPVTLNVTSPFVVKILSLSVSSDSSSHCCNPTDSSLNILSSSYLFSVFSLSIFNSLSVVHVPILDAFHLRYRLFSLPMNMKLFCSSFVGVGANAITSPVCNILFMFVLGYTIPLIVIINLLPLPIV